MEFRDDLDRSIYAAAYVTEFNRLHACAVQIRTPVGHELDRLCASDAMEHAEAVVPIRRSVIATSPSRSG